MIQGFPHREAIPWEVAVGRRAGLVRIVVAVLILIGSVFATPVLANAQPSGSNNASTPKFLKLSLDSVSPSTVTTTSDPRLTVSGTVTNIGDRVVEDISVRIQRAAAVTTPSDLRYALRLDQINYEVTGPFEDVAERLSPGQRKQFTLSIALRGSEADSLGLTQAGVYPLLLNVNGEPAYGSQARLDDARFLLPVLGLPPADGEPAAPAPADVPVATTLIWPLADRPRLVGGQPGAVNRTAELTDDELAASLARGGRLDQLLAALENAIGNSGRTGPAAAICVAVDPDLLLTAQAMTKGYRVLASPSDPGGQTRAGSGAEAAQAWLDRLRTVAASVCTVALPFGQVDVSALAAVNDPDLSARALRAPAEIVDSILTTKSVRGVSLPDSGSIDNAAGTLLRGHGFRTAVLADTAAVPVGTAGTSDLPDAATDRGGPLPEPAAPDLVRVPGITAPDTGPPDTEVAESSPTTTSPPASTSAAPSTTPSTPSKPVTPVDPALRVAPFDIWSATALAAVGSNPPTPSYTPSRVRYDVTIDSRIARLQDAIGAVSWTALNPLAGRPRSQLLMPPQQWGANKDEATALLKQLDLLIRNNLATPRPFTELLAGQPDPAPYELDYLGQAARDAVPSRFVPPARDQSARITDLLDALVEVPEAEPTPREFLDPLRDDLIRVLSLSDRRTGNATQPDTFAQRRVDQNTTAVDKLYNSVTVLPPGGLYTLASEQSPLLLVARNDLPVSVRVRFRIEAPSETKITDIGEQALPPNASRSFQIPAEIDDSRYLVIPISLTTAEGIPLGHPTSVSVRSNAYGQTLAIMTGCAGLLLFLLAGRRLWHRFRGQPDPADEGFDPKTRRRVNRYLRARKRALREES
ncbi:DUF6049 family protein [Nocardia sp. NPDC127579]|uniref:DUF6049 family protein n=1 Tax=Nocardia sp. NPDC127579 TaxID=3345402 RepID=UPI00363D8E80